MMVHHHHPVYIMFLHAGVRLSFGDAAVMSVFAACGVRRQRGLVLGARGGRHGSSTLTACGVCRRRGLVLGTRGGRHGSSTPGSAQLCGPCKGR